MSFPKKKITPREEVKNGDVTMSSSEALKKVMAFIGGYRFLLLVSILLAGLTVVLQLYVPILFGDAIDSILGKGQVDFSGVQVRLVKIAGMIVACAAGNEHDQ